VVEAAKAELVIHAMALRAEHGARMVRRRGLMSERIYGHTESLRLDPSLREAAAQRATAEGVTVSEVIRRALREYLHTA
jgi:predicted HicB family RNase H-like nuclease